MPVTFPHHRRKKAHQPSRISNNRTDIDLLTRWKRVAPGIAELHEAQCSGDIGAMVPTGPYRHAGDVIFDPSEGIATLTYQLPYSGRTVVQSWLDSSLASAERGAIAIVEHLALDAPAVEPLDRLIIRRGHDPDHFGQLVPDNPVLEAIAPIAALSRQVNQLDQLMQLSPSNRQSPQIKSQIDDLVARIGKCNKPNIAYATVPQSPEWAGGKRLIALYIWAKNFSLMCEAQPDLLRDDLVTATAVRCVLDRHWPYT